MNLNPADDDRRESVSRRGRKATHGCSDTKLYGVWISLKQRCLNPSNKDFASYGGRGIEVCEQWRNSFATFMTDMGPRPSPHHSLERKDNNGPYAPWNCVWATQSEQNSNQRPRTICKRGHELSGANLYINSSGKKVCRSCQRNRTQEYRERRRDAR